MGRHAHLALRMRSVRLTGRRVTCWGASSLPQGRFLSRPQPPPPLPPGAAGALGGAGRDQAQAGFGSGVRYAAYPPPGEGKYRAAGEMEALGQGRAARPAAREWGPSASPPLRPPAVLFSPESGPSTDAPSPMPRSRRLGLSD